MSVYLLDVIALFDPDHARHDAAHSWFQSEGGRLATFDRRLAPDAIMNGRDGLVLLE